MLALRVFEEDLYDSEASPSKERSSSSYPRVPARIIEYMNSKRHLDSHWSTVTEDDFWDLGGADSSAVFLGFMSAQNDVSTVESEISPNEQIRLAVHILSFTKRQLGELFGVSRQAIYDWLKGEVISNKNASRLAELAGMLGAITTVTRRPLYRRYTTEPITAEDPSILDLLREEEWDTGRILNLLRKAREMTTSRVERQGTYRSRVSQSKGDENFLNNMRSLGEG